MLKINGVDISVAAVAIKRSIRRVEKYRVTCEDGKVHSEVAARYMDFSLELGCFDRDVYNRLFALLQAGGELTLELDGAEYIGLYDGVSDEVFCEENGEYYWDNLVLNFVATRPLEVAE